MPLFRPQGTILLGFFRLQNILIRIIVSHSAERKEKKASKKCYLETYRAVDTYNKDMLIRSRFCFLHATQYSRKQWL
jgi:hypothetical protein